KSFLTISFRLRFSHTFSHRSYIFSFASSPRSVRVMMTNQNGGDVHPVVASSPLTPDQHQQLLRERLRAYHDSMYCFSLNDYYSLETGASPSPSLSDLQSLESSFRRLDVTGVNACPQPLIDNCQSNQFPLNGRDRGMNGNEYSLPLNYQQEQSQRLLYPMDDCVNGFRVTATTLSRAKDRGESQRLLKVIAEGSRKTIDKIFEDLVSQVCELMIDPIGHEVLQKLFEKCTDEQITRVLDIVIQQPIQFIRICGDSHGTHAIQDLMRCLGSDEQISRLMVTLCHVALVLTKSINANHVILFCFTHFSPSQNRYLLQVIAQNCYQVAIDQFGCCMLQQCIGKSYQEIRDPLIEKIITHSMSLCVNCYGNYVVQFVLELEDFHVAAALSKYFDGNYAQLSCDKYGSHAVQRCLTSRQFNSRKIVNELISDIDSLLVNPFGNYVIQTAWVVSQVIYEHALDSFCVK
ncbi:hypothetical protein EUTSA_v10009481mg, partial [Eutrema salsugineum]